MTSPTDWKRPVPNAVQKIWLRLKAWYERNLAVSTASRVLLFGLLMSVFCAIAVMLLVQERESKRIDEEISGSLSTIESTLRVACFTGDVVLAKEAANGLLSNRAIAAVRVVSGAMVLAEEGQLLGTLPPGMKTIRRKISSPFNEADQVGEVIVVADDDYIHRQVSSYSSFVAVISLLEMLAVFFVVAAVVLRTIVRPIQEFSRKLRVTDVYSGGCVQPPRNNETNELGHLVYSFNNLLDGQHELLKSEQALCTEIAQKEGHFRALAENSPNMLVRYDLEYRRVYCNPAYNTKFGLMPGEALNKRPEQLWQIGNISAQEYQAILQRVMASGTSETVLLEWTQHDGRYAISDFHLVPERDEEGRVSSVLAIGHDISQLKKQQRLDMDRALVFENVVQGGEIGDVLCMVAGHVKRAMSGYQCAILLLDETGSRLSVAAAPNMPPSFRAEVDGIARTYDAANAHEYWADYIHVAECYGMKVCRHERILDSNQRKLGMLVLHRNEGGDGGEIDMSFLRQACSLAAIAIERKRSEELIRHQASYDALTDLPNRRMFIDRLRGEILKSGRTGNNVTLLFIDLDRFKGVNDTLGHEVGDDLLIAAALRIRQCVRESDLVARLGGDEFVVLISDLEDVSLLGRLAREIAEVLCEPFPLGLHTAYISASIGIASYPTDADGPDRLVSCADQAMYAAKDAGRNGFQFYSAELSQNANERLELEIDLRQAIRHGELELYYQPKVSLAEGEPLTGSEALLRWKHPVRGMVMPDKFVRIAEDCGLIMELGEWVLREACRQASAWNGDGKPLHKVAINMSARQFQAVHLYEQVCAILEETACLPEWIELEITESLLLEEGGEILETLNLFRRQGITLAIDDFGTGYSALSYLARFPINTLKIDRSFTSQVTGNGYHAEVIKAILSIAQSLGQQVVAEGVETAAQAEMLRGYGCHVAQGYWYGKPVPREMFEELHLCEKSTGGVRELRMKGSATAAMAVSR